MNDGADELERIRHFFGLTHDLVPVDGGDNLFHVPTTEGMPMGLSVSETMVVRL
jgi:hypothetical protein